MHRNTRETLPRYHQLGLLDRPPPQRVPRETVFDFAMVEEREVYDAVTSYIDRRFDELESEKPGKGFVMTIYRRRAASSPYALRRSLERRKKGLKAVIAQLAPDPSVLGIEDAQELEDLLDVDLTAALPESPEVARRELAEVESLISRIEGLGGLDSKRDRLDAELKSLVSDGRAALLFTGYADTMEYLRDHLVTAFGATVASYSGEGGAVREGGVWRSVSKGAVTEDLESGSVKVLVCTDAASEGLNLQSEGALVNFDMPWNPSRVEQRIGRIDRIDRIDRIGQKHPKLPIVNMFLEDSVDLRVYRALESRCHLFTNFVGPMQPILSLAMRELLVGRDSFDAAALRREAAGSAPSGFAQSVSARITARQRGSAAGDAPLTSQTQ